MPKINPDRLRELREHAGFSQAELAKSLDVDTSLISRWENGAREPSLSQLMVTARILGVTLDYLLHSRLEVHFQFRSKKTLNATEKAAIERALVDAEMQLHNLDACYTLSKQLPKPFTLKMDFYPQQVATIAAQMRDTLKLNLRVTLEELKQALTELNVHVFEWLLPWEMSGLSYRNAFTVIFLNYHHTKERRLFTLAHELAHILFHLGRDTRQTIVSLIASNREPEEKEANAFAAELLIPEATLNTFVEKFGRELRQIAVLDSVARWFNVSRQALFYRLVEKDIFTWQDKRFYFTAPKTELTLAPVRVKTIEEQVAPEFLRLALQVYDQKQISAGKLKEWFLTDRITLEEFLTKRSEIVEDVLEFEEE